MAGNNMIRHRDKDVDGNTVILCLEKSLSNAVGKVVSLKKIFASTTHNFILDHD